MQPRVFFGYPSSPDNVRAGASAAARSIADTGLVEVTTWEELPIGGRLVINQVLAAIEEADLCVFDVTTLNQNVLFELGYAVTREKRVWLLLNKSVPEADHNWKSLDLLAPAGYVPFNAPDDVRAAFLQEQPHLSTSTLWEDLTEALSPQEPRSLFYMPNLYNSEGSRALTRRVEREQDFGVRLVTADPSETGPAPLSWYAEQVYGTGGTLVHLAGESRPRAKTHNARSAFIGGMARGLERPVLMVVEDDYSRPLDYRNLLYVYPSRRKLVETVSDWLRVLPPPDPSVRQHTTSRRLRLATELRSLRLGEHVAENESDSLDEYFVETAEYNSVLSSRNVVFVGRKGVGKTASMLQAAEELRSDKRNLVCVIKPSSYEWEGLIEVIKSLGTDAAQSYFIEALWRFLLFSEIAQAAVETAERLPARITPGTPLSELRDLLQDPDAPLREEFSVRLEGVLASAIGSLIDLEKQSVEEQRRRVNEALYTNSINGLRKHLGEALQDRNRVAILLDNLDKAWTRTADLDILSRLLLGLLTAVGRVAADFQKEDAWRESVNVSLAVFVRQDIFSYVIKFAREPDKINVLDIDWDQRELLLSVVEERFLAVRPDGTLPEELWERFFCPTVDGQPLRDYILNRILHRPRDLIFFCNAAILHAVNGRHERVEEDDVRAAERQYSRFAFDALLVENGITIPQLESVLFEFLGTSPWLERDEVLSLIASVGIPDKEPEAIMRHLTMLTFLGVEVFDERVEYADSEETLTRALVFERKAAEKAGRPMRHRVHPAYRPFLEIPDQ